MIKRTFSTLASKLEHDNKVVQYYKHIFVSHDTINKYMAMTIGITGAGYLYIQQDIKELKSELKEDIKELKSDIKDLKDLMIASNQQRK